MLQVEHSAILSTFIKLPFVIQIFVLPIFEWSLKTGFTVHYLLLVSIFLTACRTSLLVILKPMARRALPISSTEILLSWFLSNKLNISFISEKELQSNHFSKNGKFGNCISTSVNNRLNLLFPEGFIFTNFAYAKFRENFRIYSTR